MCAHCLQTYAEELVKEGVALESSLVAELRAEVSQLQSELQKEKKARQRAEDTKQVLAQRLARIEQQLAMGVTPTPSRPSPSPEGDGRRELDSGIRLRVCSPWCVCVNTFRASLE